VTWPAENGRHGAIRPSQRIIIIRLRRNADPRSELRARIVTLHDVHPDDVENVVVSSAEEVRAPVRDLVCPAWHRIGRVRATHATPAAQCGSLRAVVN